MNVVFSNYGTLENNSAHHIKGFAKCLSKLGHDVVICVVKANREGSRHPSDGYRTICHKEALAKGILFSDGRHCDILHVWTPREISRNFVEKYRSKWQTRATLIHLEDNELVLFERCTGYSPTEIDDSFPCPSSLTDPRKLSAFYNGVDGFTTVHECLNPLVPAHRPRIEITPIIDFEFFSPDASNKESWDDWSPLKRPSLLVGYNGNDHQANTLDIQQLYTAIDILAAEGFDICLVRTGITIPERKAGYEFVKQGRLVDLGFVDRQRIPGILHELDMAVQPGNDDPFNSHRLPSKIPEYLAAGIPLITNRTNIGQELYQARAAIVLSQSDAPSLAEAIRFLANDSELAANIGEAGRAFALDRFAEDRILPLLENFYEQTLQATLV